MEYCKEYVLKNGEKLIVKTATAQDCERLAQFANAVHKQTKYLGFSTNERKFTPKEEVEYVEKMNNSPDSMFLAGFLNGEIVGTTQITPKSKYNWKKHICDFGVAVEKSCWGLGIAGKLMDSIIDCAKQIGYEQIELTVVAKNTNAINLYKSFGFELCGVIKNAYKFSDNDYSDGCTMQKFLLK